MQALRLSSQTGQIVSRQPTVTDHTYCEKDGKILLHESCHSVLVYWLFQQHKLVSLTIEACTKAS